MPCTTLAPLTAADADAALDARAQVVCRLVQLVGAELLVLLGPHDFLLSGVELEDDLLYAVGVHAQLHIQGDPRHCSPPSRCAVIRAALLRAPCSSLAVQPLPQRHDATRTRLA